MIKNWSRGRPGNKVTATTCTVRYTRAIPKGDCHIQEIRTDKQFSPIVTFEKYHAGGRNLSRRYVKYL